MNLFLKKLLGVMQSTEKMESKDNQLFTDFIHYKKFEGSEVFAEYKRLFDIVKSADFKEKRKILKTRKYKDTQEYHDLKAFNSLEKNSDLKQYFQITKSKQLADYLTFKETDEYYKLNNKAELEKSSKLQEYKDFRDSKEYKHYVRFHNSFPVKEYLRLKDKVSSAEFQKENEFWKNKNRWQTTKEYAMQTRFYEILNSEDGQFYFSTDLRKFRRIADLTIYKKDYFKYKNIGESQWKAEYYYSNPQLKTVHSSIDEQQANTGGKNVSVGDGLIITTKKQKYNGVVWHPSKGFIEKEYEYTSDIINGHNLVEDEYCGIRIKMRCSGNLNHAFWLSSGEKIPHINVALIKGKTIEVGVYDARGDYYYTTIRGINPADYYIYSIYQKNGFLIWRINNIEVFRTRNIISERRFFPCFSSFIPNTQKKPSEGQLDIEWVEIYK